MIHPLWVWTGKFLPLRLLNNLINCSDGLYDLVSEEDMIVILSSDNSLEQMANQLVNLAKQHGGHDNITVLLASENEQFSIPQLRSTSEFDIPIMNEN